MGVPDEGSEQEEFEIVRLGRTHHERRMDEQRRILWIVIATRRF